MWAWLVVYLLRFLISWFRGTSQADLIVPSLPSGKSPLPRLPFNHWQILWFAFSALYFECMYKRGVSYVKRTGPVSVMLVR